MRQVTPPLLRSSPWVSFEPQWCDLVEAGVFWQIRSAWCMVFLGGKASIQLMVKLVVWDCIYPNLNNPFQFLGIPNIQTTRPKRPQIYHSLMNAKKTPHSIKTTRWFSKWPFDPPVGHQQPSKRTRFYSPKRSHSELPGIYLFIYIYKYMLCKGHERNKSFLCVYKVGLPFTCICRLCCMSENQAEIVYFWFFDSIKHARPSCNLVKVRVTHGTLPDTFSCATTNSNINGAQILKYIHSTKITHTHETNWHTYTHTHTHTKQTGTLLEPPLFSTFCLENGWAREVKKVANPKAIKHGSRTLHSESEGWYATDMENPPESKHKGWMEYQKMLDLEVKQKNPLTPVSIELRLK